MPAKTTRRLWPALAKGSLRGKRRELAEAVPGLIRDHHRFVLRRHLDLIDELTRQIERIEARIAAHFASWARVCPGNRESAGKRKSASVGSGNAWLRDALSQVAWGAARTKGSYYRALSYRRRARGGPRKAVVAVQHAILVTIWHMLTTGSLHEDLGPDHFERHDTERRKHHLVNQLRKMGVEVEIKDQAA